MPCRKWLGVAPLTGGDWGKVYIEKVQKESKAKKNKTKQIAWLELKWLPCLGKLGCDWLFSNFTFSNSSELWLSQWTLA